MVVYKYVQSRNMKEVEIGSDVEQPGILGTKFEVQIDTENDQDQNVEHNLGQLRS